MTDNIEIEISKIFTKILKEVGGRGAKSIFVKNLEHQIEIHFVLNKSNLEEFIFTYFDDATSYLENLNERIAAIVSQMIKNKMEEKLKVEIIEVSYEIDIFTDTYCMKFKKKNYSRRKDV